MTLYSWYRGVRDKLFVAVMYSVVLFLPLLVVASEFTPRCLPQAEAAKTGGPQSAGV